MTKLAKIVVTFIVIFVFLILSILNSAARKAAGYSTPGVVGLILLMGMIGAIKAIWKKEDNNKKKIENRNDSSILQK